MFWHPSSSKELRIVLFGTITALLDAVSFLDQMNVCFYFILTFYFFLHILNSFDEPFSLLVFNLLSIE